MADRVIGPMPEPAEVARMKKEAMVLAREIGRLQTGRPVDLAWAMAALALLAEQALGVTEWSLDGETSAPALDAILRAGKAQAAHDRQHAAGKELARAGSPF